LLHSKPDFADFFIPLREAGLFSPQRNPSPVPAGEPGFFRVPYWSALDYLEAVAKRAGELGDVNLAELVMDIVRAVSRASDYERDGFSNYHTSRKFADIMGLVPTSVVRFQDLELIPKWLSDRFDHGSVARSLAEGVLKHLLKSGVAEDWNKAAEIVRHCTAIRWVDESGGEGKRPQPVSIVEDHWLKELIDRHVPSLARRVGRKAADIFSARLREVFAGDGRENLTWLWRPAIEDHAQNHRWRNVENRMVEGLRETLLHWVDHDADAAVSYVDSMLKDHAQIIRRIALNTINQRWDALRSMFSALIGPNLFEQGLLHETYHLLERHFQSFSDTEKTATLKAIRELPKPEAGEDSERYLRHKHRDWLSAIAGKGSAEADAWFEQLLADSSLGALSGHPSFNSYMETWRGPGPSPYQPQELLAFAQVGTLTEILNSFTETDSWRGPTTRALVDALEEAIIGNPPVFVDLVPSFLRTRRPYQYGLLNAFKRLWETNRSTIPDWSRAWHMLFSFMEELLLSDAFWTEAASEDANLTPTRDWIPSLVAELLRAGTRDDSAAYPAEFLERGWALIRRLLERTEALTQVTDDAMTDAINSPKGKAIEALFSHALRACRLSDRERGNHTETWEHMRPVFDTELSLSRNGNYEFSTLLAAYIGNLYYLDRSWVQGNVVHIFPPEYPLNFACALNGLAYAQFGRDVYLLLLERGVFDRALRQDLKDRNASEKVIERLAVMYLWGDEALDSPRLSYLFEERRVRDLVDIAHFFWSISNDKQEPAAVARILEFWERCVQWARDVPDAAPQLLSALSRLACYLHTIEPREAEWLLAVAPHVAFNHNDTDFVEELLRLVDTNPAAVNSALGAMLEKHVPMNDFENKLEALLKALAAKGYRLAVMRYAEKLRGIRGVLELFRQLEAVPPS
jgi:hypothetical protein